MSEAREKYYMKMNNEFIVIDKITAGNYSDELEQQKAELIEALRDVRLSTLYGMQCISIEKIEELLKKHGVEI